MTGVSGSAIRLAGAGDVDALASYIAHANADPAHECLHTPGTRKSVIREALLRVGGLSENGRSVFVLACSNDGAISGAFGCQSAPADDVGWLWGPWVSIRQEWKIDAPAMLRALLAALPRRVRRLDAFLNIKNENGLAFLQDRDFAIRSPTYIYIAAAAEWDPVAAGAPFPDLAARHEVGFARLHRETFPAGESASPEELLAGRDDEHAIFVAADDLRLLGYACVSENAAPREGFIDYLAVRPAARGHGIGRSLLQTALRWVFETRRLPQAALCVTGWRDDARRLYERAGFRLSATGRGARRQL